MGIDVESAGPGRSVLENPEWYLSPSETRGLEALAPAKRTERFFALWTLKEAFLKASGMGLAARPQALSFELDQHRSPAVSFSPAIREEPCDWQFFALAASERHPLAVAARRPLGGDVELHVHEARQIPLPPQDGAASHGG